MTCPDDRDRAWEIQREVRRLAYSIPLTAPRILVLAEELDQIVNRLMGIGPEGPTEKRQTLGALCQNGVGDLRRRR